MASSRLLADNDALIKAVHWDLLDLVPALVDGTWADVACLPTFPPRVHRAEPRLFTDPTVAAQLETQLKLCGELPAPDVSVLTALQAEPGIDAGELLLVGALATVPNALLLTGDKRALRALAGTATAAALQHRCICIEQLLWLALDHHGAAPLLDRVRRWEPRDQSAMAIFGRTGDKSEVDLREGLVSYVRALDTEAPGLLMRGFGLEPNCTFA